MFLALAVFADNLTFFAVKLDMIVPATSEAHWGFAYVIWQAGTYTFSMSIFRLHPTIWYCAAIWG